MSIYNPALSAMVALESGIKQPVVRNFRAGTAGYAIVNRL
jgi:hypothetical protein